jgi:multiple antibiotic resistance protein
MWVVMVLLSRRGSRARGGLLHDTGTQFMGLIVLAMGVQFALTGFQDFLVAQR